MPQSYPTDGRAATSPATGGALFDGIDPEPECPACGGRLRFRGRRGAAEVWECEAADCPAGLVELHDPAALERRGRGGRP